MAASTCEHVTDAIELDCRAQQFDDVGIVVRRVRARTAVQHGPDLVAVARENRILPAERAVESAYEVQQVIDALRLR
jgi:hypothetical protein